MAAFFNWLSQIGAVTKFGLLSIPQRRASVAAAFMGIAGVVGVLLLLAVAGVVRTHRGIRPVRIAALCVTLLLLAQVVAGAVLVELRLRSATRGIHLALASALWAATAVLAILVRPGTLPSEEPGRELAGAAASAPRTGPVEAGAGVR